ncbi:MAG TPA: metal-dependent hydrolase [Microthrixaceae bacterium]|nr:metal-dependent hydrolase [Microthrixaceae bacterium]
MNGHDHALFGLAAYQAAVLAGVTTFGQPPPGLATIALGAAVAVGAALIADVDEQHSVSAQGLGVAGAAVRVASSATGGHRTLTHYPLLCVGGLIALCRWLIGAGPGWWFAGLCGVMIAAGTPHLIGKKRRSKAGPFVSVVALGAGALAAWLLHRYNVAPDWWLYAAVPIPYLAHLVGDTPTPAGVPWLHPLSSRKFGLPVFHSGGTFENTVVCPLLIAANAFALYRLHVANVI